MASHDRLSVYDAIFYFTDSDRVSMQANVAIMVDGAIDYSTYVETIRGAVDKIPHMRCTLRRAPLNIRTPAWIPAEDFHIEDHVSEHELPAPGSDDAFKALATELVNSRIGYDRPLWRLHVIQGLAGGRSAILLRWHHSMADAEATLAILKSLLEHELPEDDANQRMKGGGIARQSSAKGTLGKLAGLFTPAGMKRLALFGQYALLPGPRFPFFKPVSGRVTLAWREIPLDDLRQIARATSGTVTDVVLAALGSAADAYARAQGVKVAGKYLRLQVPANVRLPDEYGELGNVLAMLPGVVPLGIDDPVERLQQVTNYNRKLKDLEMASAIHSAMGFVFGAMTPMGQAVFCRTVTARPYLNVSRHFLMPPTEHALMSSIVLPDAKYAVQGHRVTSMRNFVASQFNMGFVCSPVTYEGQVTFTLSADAENLGDAETMCDYFMAGVEELKRKAQSA